MHRGLVVALVAVGLFLSLPFLAFSQSTVTFDFDTGIPALSTGMRIPFSQTSGGVTAQFSSPSGSVFSVQTDVSTTWHFSRFSGHYLYDDNQNRNALDIRFSQPVTSVSLTFATADFQQVEVPTTIQIAAYVNSTGTPALNTASAHGVYASDTMPMGTLSVSSATPFSVVEIGIPFQPLGAAAYLVDNVVVTVAPAQTLTFTTESSFLAALAGYATATEGFEDSVSWGGARNPSLVSSVVSNGIIWSSNHPYAMATPDGVSTGGVAAHTGAWGAFSLPHGNPDSVSTGAPTNDGVMGTRVPGQNLLYGAGCWVSGNIGGHLVVVLDGDSAHAIDFGSYSVGWQYFGVTSTKGFSSFEFRDIQGVSPESRYLFVDDCTSASGASLTSVTNLSSASLEILQPQAPGAIATNFGAGLASTTQGSTNPPSVLGNASVTVTDSAGVQQQSSLYYASPNQINFVIPATAAVGPALVSVSVGGQLVATGPMMLQVHAPGVFTANMNGQGPPAAFAITTAANGSQTGQWPFTCGTTILSCVPAPIDLGAAGSTTVLTFYGTGVRGYSSLANVVVGIGGVPVQVLAIAPVSGSPGLDRLDVVIPSVLAGAGAVDLQLIVDGVSANIVNLNIK